MTADSDTQPEPGAPSDNTAVSGIVRALVDDGFDAQFVPSDQGGKLRCTRCESSSPIQIFDVREERRLEGASDPDDMVIVVAAACPVCGAKGSIVLGYGPEASAEDSDLVAGLSAPPRST